MKDKPLVLKLVERKSNEHGCISCSSAGYRGFVAHCLLKIPIVHDVARWARGGSKSAKPPVTEPFSAQLRAHWSGIRKSVVDASQDRFCIVEI